jgi:hypothetical protein
MSYSHLYATKAQRATWRRHLPAWFAIHLGVAPYVYLRIGNHQHVWLLDTLFSFYLGFQGSDLRGSTRRQRAASALGRRLAL